MNVTEAIRARRSIRKYKSGHKMCDEHIKIILEAGMHAPSAKNTRPWEFIVLKSDEAKKKALEIHPYAKHLEDACIGIVVCADSECQKDAAEGFFPQDCGAAIENILLQSLELGYGSCWCGIYPREERTELFRKEFDISSIPVALVVIGIADDSPQKRGFYDENKVRIL